MSKFITSHTRVSSESSPNNAESSTSSLMAEDKGFLSDDEHYDGCKVSRRSSRPYPMKWQNWSILISLLILIAGLSVWGHVVVLLRSFRCDTTPETDHFEPDCEFISSLALGSLEIDACASAIFKPSYVPASQVLWWTTFEYYG